MRTSKPCRKASEKLARSHVYRNVQVLRLVAIARGFGASLDQSAPRSVEHSCSPKGRKNHDAAPEVAYRAGCARQYQSLALRQQLMTAARRRVSRPARAGQCHESRGRARDRLADCPRRLNFVRALLNAPKMLFLDEPTNGLDPINSRVLKDMVLDFRPNKAADRTGAEKCERSDHDPLATEPVAPHNRRQHSRRQRQRGARREPLEVGCRRLQRYRQRRQGDPSVGADYPSRWPNVRSVMITSNVKVTPRIWGVKTCLRLGQTRTKIELPTTGYTRSPARNCVRHTSLRSTRPHDQLSP